MMKAVIFDVDGVLIDTAHYHFKSWQKLAHSLDRELPSSLNDQLRGMSRVDSLNIVLNHLNVTKSELEKEQLANHKNQWFLESISHIGTDVILPGVVSFLQHLQDTNIPMATASASKNACKILSHLGLDQYFVSMLDANHVKHTKPHPEVFIKSARNLQVNEKSCVVFEDIGIGESQILTNTASVLTGFENLTWDMVNAILA